MNNKTDFIYNSLSEEDKKRFWSKVHRLDQSSCWNWLAGLDKNGYGRFAIGRHRKQTHLRAHRVAYCLAIEGDIPRFINGDEPVEIVVRHKCDNPRCVNPEHLFLATHQENMADKVAKGRQAKGTKNAKTKLTELQVQEIRARIDAEQTPSEILKAMKLKLDPYTIYAIRTGRTWRHVS